MYEPDAFSILPPLLAILLAIATRQVIISLGVGHLGRILPVSTRLIPCARCRWRWKGSSMSSAIREIPGC